MTTRDDARRRTGDGRDALGRPDLSRGPSGVDPDRDDDPRPVEGAGRAALPERLYAARERKGVDLYRAERDTKIRARYLAALERGEYRELPGDVYTKGFLRNYALYLGLDPEEVVAQWRRERGEAVQPRQVLTVPKPIAQPRRGLQFSPGVVVAALLTVLIVAVAVYLGVQVMRFAKPPTLAVTAPREASITLDEDATKYTLQGTSIPGATITIELAGGTRQVSADTTGFWSQEIELRRGKNQFRIDAMDPETGKHAEQAVEVVISVPFREIEAPGLTVNQPEEGATFQNGAIPVQGTATNATQVTVEATYLGAVGPPGAPIASSPPAPSAAPGASAGPGAAPVPGGPTVAPVTVAVADDGSWNTPLQLTTGRWSIVVTASNAQGKTNSLTRNVAVAYKGVNLVVTIKGSNAWIKVWVDGKLDADVASGRTYADGKTLTFTGQTSIEVRTGSSGATFFTLNGQALGALGKRGIPETWLFQPPNPPTKTQHQ
jgi:cytoskeletal protein RodZ